MNIWVHVIIGVVIVLGLSVLLYRPIGEKFFPQCENVTGDTTLQMVNNCRQGSDSISGGNIHLVFVPAGSPVGMVVS